MKEQNFPKGLIKPTKTRQEIQDGFNMSWRALNKRLDYHQIELPPGFICPKDQALIYEALGIPPSFESDEEKKR
jgi:hypothetical protein